GPPPMVAAVTSAKIGYVRHIDVEALERVATTAGGEIHVDALPGAFVDTANPIAWLDFTPDEAAIEAVRAAFNVGARRSFDQDPRFGLIVLSEIASKALSPAVNDPGT